MMARATLALLLVAAMPARALAQTSGEASAIAEQLFQQGRDLMKQHDLASACPKLAESNRLDPKLGTLLNLAVCHEQQGKTASAWAEYTSAAAIAGREGQREREDFARTQAAALKQRLAHVVLTVSSTDPSLVVQLDGKPMSAAVFGVPLPVDPGTHQITASAPGKAAWTQTLEVPAQPGEIAIAIPELAKSDAPPVPVVPPPPPAVAPGPPVTPVTPVAPVTPMATPAPVRPPPSGPLAPPASEQAPSRLPTVLISAGFGAGGLGVVIGTITGLVTIANTSSIRARCTGDACPGQTNAISTANTLANVSNAMFAVGLAGVAIGVTGIVLRQRDARTTAIVVQPIVGPASGVRVRF